METQPVVHFFNQQDLVFNILLYTNFREWKSTRPFIINKIFHQAFTSEGFACAYYSNLKSLSTDELNSLRQLINIHSINYYQHHSTADSGGDGDDHTFQSSPPTKKIKKSSAEEENQPFWSLLKMLILDKPIVGVNNNMMPSLMMMRPSTSNFGWITTTHKKDNDSKLHDGFYKMLELDFHVISQKSESMFKELLVIPSHLVKELLQLQKTDVKVHNFDMTKACYFNSSSCTMNIEYTICLDCGYPLRIQTKFLDLSVRSGNYLESALSTSINGIHVFEWNYNDSYFPKVYVNEHFLTSLQQDLFESSPSYQEFTNLLSTTSQELSDSVGKVFKSLFLKVLDPDCYLGGMGNLISDPDYVNLNVDQKSNLYYSSKFGLKKLKRF